MELPKNIVQIGEMDETHKVYIEDYVLSYMKKLIENNTERCGVALFGHHRYEGDRTYTFLYGAAEVAGLAFRDKSYSEAEGELIEEIRRNHFDETECCGWCNMRGEIPEQIILQFEDKTVRVTGYGCFYDKNDAMLSFMMEEENQSLPAEKVSSRGNWRVSDLQQMIADRKELSGRNPETEETHVPHREEKNERDSYEIEDRKRRGYGRLVPIVAIGIVCLIVALTVKGADGPGAFIDWVKHLGADWNTEKLTNMSLTEENDVRGIGEVAQNSGDLASLPIDAEQTGTSENAEGAFAHETGNLAEQFHGSEERDGESVSDRELEPDSGNDLAEGSGVPSAGNEDSDGSGLSDSGNQSGNGSDSLDSGNGASDQSGLSEAENEAASGNNSSDVATGEKVDAGDGQPGDNGTGNGDTQSAGTEGGEALEAGGNAISNDSGNWEKYTIGNGDTLTSICTMRYGSLDNLNLICRVNGIVNPDHIQIGQTILLP